MLEQYLGLNGYLGSTDRAVLLANGTGGLTAQASSLTLSANNCLTIPGSTLTASEPLLNLSQTWNNAGVAFTGLKFDVTDSNSASGSLLADFRVGGSSKFSVRKDGVGVFNVAASQNITLTTYAGTTSIAWTGYNGGGQTYMSLNSFGLINSRVDSYWDGPQARVRALSSNGSISYFQLFDDNAANTLALRNGVNAQAFNIYNTYTSGTNYERGELTWGSTANFFMLRTVSGSGGGSGRPIWINSVSDVYLTAGGGGSGQWRLNTSGHLLAQSDNTYDIGASGATRPRTGYFGTSVIAPAIKLNQGTTTTLAKAGGTLAGLPNVTAVGNVGAGEDDLMTYTIPANTLATNGDTLVFEGLFAAVESARIKAYFNATQIGYGGCVLVADDAPGCIVRIILTRLSATTACASLEGGTGAYGLNNEAALMTGLDFTASNTFKFTGQSDGGTPADNDVVQRSLIGRYYPAN